MPRVSKLPNDATPLWRWMHEHRVTLEELAALLKLSPNHVGEVRRGVKRPPDPLKELIATVTKAYEARLGLKDPRGVIATDWYLPIEKPKEARKHRAGIR